MPTAFPADLVAPEEDLLQTVYDMRPLPLQVGAVLRAGGGSRCALHALSARLLAKGPGCGCGSMHGQQSEAIRV